MKKKLVLSALILLVGSSLFITRKENISKEIAIEDLENSKSIAIYIKDENGNYNKTNSIPTSGYTLNTTKSVCTNNATPSWNIKTNSLKISNLTSKDTGCYLYFEIDNTMTATERIESMGLTATAGTTSFTGPSSSDEARLLSGEDDDGTTYYFRGNVTNNWVQFAGFYWRIIRINGDGSIRMIYNGTSTTTTGTGTQMGTKAFNTNYNDNAYVGYMYGTAGSSTYEATHANNNPSTILGTTTDTTTLLGWYKANIVDKGYSNKISQDAGFCNDRKVVSMTGYGTLGYGANATAYGAKSRTYKADNSGWNTTQTPTFSCNQASADLFTATGSTKGNKKLTYPVGLITADEVIYAGGFGGSVNSSYYLYTNKAYWTMSPSRATNAGVFAVYSGGNLNDGVGVYSVDSAYGVRPVINISPDVKLIGDGTTSNPYRIEGVE